VKIIIIYLLFFPPMYIFSQKEKSPDYRNVYWGMSKSEVLKSEKATLIWDSDNEEDIELKVSIQSRYHLPVFPEECLLYEDRLYSYPCAIIYTFINNKLYDGEYRISHFDNEDASSVFDLLLSKYSEKYGKPNHSILSIGVSWIQSNRRFSILKLGKDVIVRYYHPNFNEIKDDFDKSKI